MRLLIVIGVFSVFAGPTYAQSNAQIRTLDDGIAILEKKLTQPTTPDDVATVRDVLLIVIGKAENALAMGQLQEAPAVPVTSQVAANAAGSTAGTFKIGFIPQTVQVRSGLCGRRYQTVTIYKKNCVWVPVTPPPAPCTECKSVLSKLGRNAFALTQRLTEQDAKINPAELAQLIRQAYSLAVMAREPFEAGHSRD